MRTYSNQTQQAHQVCAVGHTSAHQVDHCRQTCCHTGYHYGNTREFCADVSVQTLHRESYPRQCDVRGGHCLTRSHLQEISDDSSQLSPRGTWCSD
ncbi:uncharacterized protein LOC5504518 [Nematostella vectensis]|uniref:uncharacterized protein LOC5504518 n=1 Tax=Nematostella vectensis TaxID=45351 RepID=UPI002076DC33|nr:uncharacterized protein LOC5504518 [Nematostella vectensis]